MALLKNKMYAFVLGLSLLSFSLKSINFSLPLPTCLGKDAATLCALSCVGTALTLLIEEKHANYINSNNNKKMTEGAKNFYKGLLLANTYLVACSLNNLSLSQSWLYSKIPAPSGKVIIGLIDAFLGFVTVVAVRLG